MEKEKLNKQIMVEWLDAIHIPMGWQPLEIYLHKAKEHANVIHNTVGILIDETEDYVVIALSIKEGNGQILVNLAQLIHKNMIVSIEEIK